MKILPLLFLLWASDYKLALPGYQFEFPRDHGSHPEYKLEWWYWTGHLGSSEGREFGYELTFFRIGLGAEADNPSSWKATDLYPAHFALTDLGAGRFHYFEKLNRPGPGVAGAATGRLDLRNQNWTARMADGSIYLQASEDGVEIDLAMTPSKPPVIHGRDGVSQKAEGAGRASHYYSLTRLQTTGTVQVQGQRHVVTGLGWMDHEFGTNQLDSGQIGWDWFSLQFENGEDLMIYGIRLADGSLDPYSSGTVVAGDGSTGHLPRDEFSLLPGRVWTSPESGGDYPVEWTIRIPSMEADLNVRPLMDGQELLTRRSTMVAYWEGAVRVEGTWRGRPVKGRGYLEMTGYARDSRPRI